MIVAIIVCLSISLVANFVSSVLAFRERRKTRRLARAFVLRRIRDLYDA